MSGLPLNKLIKYVSGSQFLVTSVGSLGLKLSAAGFGFLSNIILARMLGAAQYGVYSIVFSAMALMATLSLLGLPSLVTRETAVYQVNRQWEHLRRLSFVAHRWVLIASIAVISLWVLLIYFDLLDLNIKGYGWTVALLIIPASAFSLLRASILRGLHQVILADFPEMFIRPVMVISIISCLYYFGFKLDVESALLIQLIAVSIALLVCSWFIFGKTPSKEQESSVSISASVWFSGAIIFMFMGFASTLERQIPLYLLGFLSSEEFAGIFQAANQMVGLVVIGLLAVNMPLQPKLSAAWARQDIERAQSLVFEASRLGFIVAVISAFVIILFARELLGLYGAEYTEAADCLRILAAGQLMSALLGPCVLVLSMTGHQLAALVGVVSALIVSVVLGFLLIPMLGIIGAAITSATGLVVWNILLSYLAWKKTGLFTPVLKSWVRR